jgi:hypothetical protein
MLRRKGFQQREQRDRSDEFRSFELPRVTNARLPALLQAPSKPVAPKIDRRVRVRPSIRESARDEDCLLLFPGCPRDRRMTIWSHLASQRGGKGMGIKAIDHLGCYGCTHCDAIYDGQAPLPEGWARWMVDLGWFQGHAVSLVKLAQKGLL